MKNLTSHYFDTPVKSLCFIHYLDVVVIWYLYGFLGVIFVFPCPLRGLTWDCGAQVRKERALLSVDKRQLAAENSLDDD